MLGASENADGSLSISGIDNSRKMLTEFWNLVNNPQKVSTNLLCDKDVELIELDGKHIIAVHVPRAERDRRPVYINNNIFDGTFRRNWEGDYHCTQAEVKAMLRDQPEETVDMKILEEFDMSVLNFDTVHGYRQRHQNYRPGHPWENLNDYEYLKNIGAARLSHTDGKLHPTAAGLLMFGNEYNIVTEFPEYFLDYRETMDPSTRWTDRLQSSSGEWSGNLCDFYFRVYNKLIQDVKVPFKFEDGHRVDDTPIHKALREGLANCLINTDYYIARGIVIRKSPEAIIMENPGDIRVGAEQMIKGGTSDPRNKALMKMFNLINIGERAGSGIPDIFSAWNSQGWQEPAIEEQFAPNRTIITLPLTQKQAEKTSGKNKRKKQAEKTIAAKAFIADFLEENGASGVQDIAIEIEKSLPRTRELMRELIQENIVEAQGEGPARKYILKDNQSKLK